LRKIRGRIFEQHELLNEYSLVLKTPDGETHRFSQLFSKYKDAPIEILIYDAPDIEWEEE
jgi:hypothetical protein